MLTLRSQTWIYANRTSRQLTAPSFTLVYSFQKLFKRKARIHNQSVKTLDDVNFFSSRYIDFILKCAKHAKQIDEKNYIPTSQ